MHNDGENITTKVKNTPANTAVRGKASQNAKRKEQTKNVIVMNVKSRVIEMKEIQPNVDLGSLVGKKCSKVFEKKLSSC